MNSNGKEGSGMTSPVPKAPGNEWETLSSAVLPHLVPCGFNISVGQFHKGPSQAAQAVLQEKSSRNVRRKLLKHCRQSKVPRIHQPELDSREVYFIGTREAKCLLVSFLEDCWHQGITSTEISKPCLLLQSINTEWLVDKSQGHQAKSSGCLLLHTAGYKLRACPPLL